MCLTHVKSLGVSDICADYGSESDTREGGGSVFGNSNVGRVKSRTVYLEKTHRS